MYILIVHEDGNISKHTSYHEAAVEILDWRGEDCEDDRRLNFMTEDLAKMRKERTYYKFRDTGRKEIVVIVVSEGPA